MELVIEIGLIFNSLYINYFLKLLLHKLQIKAIKIKVDLCNGMKINTLHDTLK